MEIFYFDGMRISQLTDNSVDDQNPQIYGRYIVWEGHDGNDKEIFYHNLLSSSTSQLTSNSYDDSSPCVYESHTAWQYFDGSDYEIHYADLSSLPVTVVPVTNNTGVHDYYPDISETRIVWTENSGTTYTIKYRDMANTIGVVPILTAYTSPPSNLTIVGSDVIWSQSDGTDMEIFIEDGTTLNQLTTNDYDDTEPRAFGSHIVWQQQIAGGTTEIMYYDGATVSRMTNNAVNDSHPVISGNSVAWIRDNGATDQIWFHDGLEAKAVANNSLNATRVEISNSKMAWQAEVSSGEFELFAARQTYTADDVSKWDGDGDDKASLADSIHILKTLSGN